jgi:hypothetical protein
MNTSTRNFLIVICLIVLCVVVGYLLTHPIIQTRVISTTTTSSTQTPSQTQTTTPLPTGPKYEPYRATLVGEYLCLPHTTTSGPQTLECALGMRTDDGRYYAVDFGTLSQNQASLSTGDRFSASGTVTPVQRLNTDQWRRYPIIGIFSVTDSVRKITPAAPTSATLQVSIGQSATGLGVTLTPLEVMSDSRCPANVNCIWAGTVTVRTKVKNEVATSEATFELGKPIPLGNENIALTAVSPQKTQSAIATSSYVFTFEVTKR